MGLTELFNEWIIERGSAKVQEKHIALFRDQLAVADKRIAELESENAALKSQVGKFKSESDNLRIMNNELAAKIKEYENPANKSSLDEPKVKILTLLGQYSADDEIEADHIATRCGMAPQAAQFHLEELQDSQLISASYYVGRPPTWFIIQEGRRYLMKLGLL